jgi:hypothetical protein
VFDMTFPNVNQTNMFSAMHLCYHILLPVFPESCHVQMMLHHSVQQHRVLGWSHKAPPFAQNPANCASNPCTMHSRLCSGVVCGADCVPDSEWCISSKLSAYVKHCSQSSLCSVSLNPALFVRTSQSLHVNICEKTTLSACFINCLSFKWAELPAFTDQRSLPRSSAGVVFRGHRQTRGASVRTPVKRAILPISERQ